MPKKTAPATDEPLQTRRQLLLEAAARVFCVQGFKGATLRQIADEAGILAGSVYHHFPSKDALFIEVQHEGFRRMLKAIDEAVQRKRDPWQRLEALLSAHLQEMLSGDAVAKVTGLGLLDGRDESLKVMLQGERDEYESRLRALIDALPLSRRIDRSLLRLQLLGALNWTLLWYRPSGKTPAQIAQHLVSLIRHAA